MQCCLTGFGIRCSRCSLVIAAISVLRSPMTHIAFSSVPVAKPHTRFCQCWRWSIFNVDRSGVSLRVDREQCSTSRQLRNGAERARSTFNEKEAAEEQKNQQTAPQWRNRRIGPSPTVTGPAYKRATEGAEIFRSHSGIPLLIVSQSSYLFPLITPVCCV